MCGVVKPMSNWSCRTYPTWYDIFYDYSATLQSLATITGNGTWSVICTGESKYYSEALANTTKGPNGDYSPSTVVDALNAFTSSAFPGCTENSKGAAAAPSTKVRVSQVTATSTRHVALGEQPLPDAGIELVVESEGSDASAHPPPRRVDMLCMISYLICFAQAPQKPSSTLGLGAKLRNLGLAVSLSLSLGRSELGQQSSPHHALQSLVVILEASLL